jgi:arginyl-tRNA synthetase
VYLELKNRLEERLRDVLKTKYDLDVENIPLETPPELKFGELATPIAFELARKLRKAPKVIAQEVVAALGAVEGFAGFEVAGAGYINAHLDRAAGVHRVAGAIGLEAPASGVMALVEHTSINPNKAAHVGHLRNAILGDTFVRLLRAAGQRVTVQNYIDNTGVQVADIVVALTHLELDTVPDLPISEQHTLAGIKKRIAFLAERVKRNPQDKEAWIDYFCWDLYARVNVWYAALDVIEQNQKLVDERKQIRLNALHAIEAGGNETAEIAELISTAVLRRHLETMLRLDIEYDFLPRESEILHLNFWALAFEQLKKTRVLYFETEGKNKGCWVMTRPAAASKSPEAEKPDANAPQDENSAKETDEDAKVIVRSNGTVTYVGKDIAYHLWKFGLLGRDFGYKKFFSYPDHECWISAETGEPNHPHFGGANAIYNVIDVRQTDPQANLVQALRGMGYVDQADHCIHFGYEKVALTPRCALEMGYEVAQEDLESPYILVSGRKGFGVKADDLIDKLIVATRAEVDARQTGHDEAERQKIAKQIAIGALRYFMLKYTRNSVIAFDFKDALSFEGETGPYIQYAVVRARNIFRKAETKPEAVFAELAGLDSETLVKYLHGEDAEDIWALWLRAGRRTAVLEQCIATSEPAYLAKHAFQLAQEFNNFYHRHHILTEEDPVRKTFLLATAAVVLRELVIVLGWLGIESPEAM